MTTDKQMTYETLDSKVTKILTDAYKKMEDTINEYNKINEDVSEIDTVDLTSKFDPIYDYCEDYLQE
jgi:hypothetical protein